MKRRTFVRSMATTVAAFFVAPKVKAAAPLPALTLGDADISRIDRKPLLITDATVYWSSDGGVSWQTVGVGSIGDWDGV